MTLDQIRDAWAADARMVAAHYKFDTDALRYEVDRRSFGSFTTTLEGSPAQRDRYQRALDYATKHNAGAGHGIATRR